MDNANFIEDFQKNRSYLFKNFTFEEEKIVISMANIRNDRVIFHFNMKI